MCTPILVKEGGGVGVVEAVFFAITLHSVVILSVDVF